jgi:hypothetical protein
VLPWLALPLLLVACVPQPDAEPDAARPLERAQLALSGAPEPPPAGDPAWEPVSLPDRWRERRPDAGGFAWYRLEVPGPVAPGTPWAVYLPQVNMNAAAWVNGAPVGSGGRFSEPVARNFNRPLYFAFPSELLDRPTNAIEIRLFAYAYLFGEPARRIGPDRAFAGTMRRRFQRATLSQVATKCP